MHSQRNNQRIAIEIKLWIFKFIRSSNNDGFAVCVEGYRRKDIEESELKNWRSTAIKERYNSQTLLTASGSIYILRGVLDEDSAYALGYPKTLVERFKDGFPFEWQELLGDYYNNVVKSNKFNESQRLHSPLLSGLFLNLSRRSHTDQHRLSAFDSTNEVGTSSLLGCNGKRGKQLTIKEKIVEEDEETSECKLSASQSSDNSANLTGEFSETFGTSFVTSGRNSMRKDAGLSMSEIPSTSCNSLTVLNEKMKLTDDQHYQLADKPEENAVFKMPFLPIQRRHLKAVLLYNWTLRFSANDLGHSKLFPNFAFVIVGFRPDKNLDWKTSCIVAVEGSRLLRTETAEYELVGPINTILAAQQGFPKEFVAQFLNGFPKDWHRILSLFFNTYIEPHLPPQQSLTISEVFDDDETENVRRYGHNSGQSMRSSRVSESYGDHSDSDLDEDSILKENNRNRRKNLKSPKRHNSRKSVQYRIDDSYHAITRQAGEGRKNQQSKCSVVPAKRAKSEEKEADLSLLKTTRSGRIIKPRLANWTGQRIVYNIHGSPIKAIGITTDSIYSTSPSNASCLSTGREVSLRRDQKRNLSNGKTRKACLVAYSDSESSSSDDENTGRRKSPLTPVTPFCGKRGPHVSRVIKSSSPEEHTERRSIRRHYKSRKNQTKTRKVCGKQECKRKKGISSKSRNAMKKDAKEQKVKETVPIVSFSDVESDNGTAEDLKIHDSNARNNVNQNPKNAKPRKWTENDNTRLKLAVEAMHPQSEEDWENIAATIRTRTAEECRKQALEVLKLKVTDERIEKTGVSEQVMEAFRKTKVGTLAYQIQADRFTRQYLKTGDVSDFFEETMDAGPSGRKVAVMPSVTTFDSDDSLLSVLRTPTPESTRRNNRRRKIIRIPESPRSDSTPKKSRDSDIPFRFNPDDEAYREQQLRYAHKMLKARNQCSTSRANTTKSSVTKDYHLNLPKIKRKKHDSDKESEEDEYFEEEEN